jgi:putative tributyrin esterase
MKIRIIIIISFLAFFACADESHDNPAEHRFFSESLAREKSFKVILPQGYDETKSYPCVYLLHGYGADPDAWLLATNILEYAKNFPFIFVLPDAENSWYVNSYTEPQEKFEDYILKDLRNYVINNYNADTTKAAVVGYSMGGYGALILALRNPDKFWFAGVMSASLDVPGRMDKLIENKREWMLESLNKKFGREKNNFREIHDPYLIYKNIPPESFPYIYLVTGIHENFRERLILQRSFADSLRVYGVLHENHETPGDHTYEYWDAELELILKRMNKLLTEN